MILDKFKSAWRIEKAFLESKSTKYGEVHQKVQVTYVPSAKIFLWYL